MRDQKPTREEAERRLDKPKRRRGKAKRRLDALGPCTYRSALILAPRPSADRPKRTPQEIRKHAVEQARGRARMTEVSFALLREALEDEELPILMLYMLSASFHEPEGGYRSDDDRENGRVADEMLRACLRERGYDPDRFLKR